MKKPKKPGIIRRHLVLFIAIFALLLGGVWTVNQLRERATINAVTMQACLQSRPASECGSLAAGTVASTGKLISTNNNDAIIKEDTAALNKKLGKPAGDGTAPVTSWQEPSKTVICQEGTAWDATKKVCVVTTRYTGTTQTNDVKTGASCPGANSSIGSGQYAQSGKNGKDVPGHDPNNFANQRECVKCEDGVWSGSFICGEGSATSYITRPDEVIDCKANPNSTANCTEGKVQGSCWRAGTWYAHTSRLGDNDYCFSGDWKGKTEYDNDMKDLCKTTGYNPATGFCNEKDSTPAGGAGNPAITTATKTNPQSCGQVSCSTSQQKYFITGNENVCYCGEKPAICKAGVSSTGTSKTECITKNGVTTTRITTCTTKFAADGTCPTSLAPTGTAFDTNTTAAEIVNSNGKVGGTASKPEDCKYRGAYLQIGGAYVCPTAPRIIPPEVEEEKPISITQTILNPDGEVGGTASKPEDCKYAGAYMQIGGLYVCPKEATGSYIAPKILTSGDKCSERGNSSCSSGDCRFLPNSNTGERDWYCMPDSTKNDRTWTSSAWNINPISGPVALFIQSMTGANALLDPSQQLPKGNWCYGSNDSCSTGYCAKNWGIMPDTCEDSPFSDTESMAPANEENPVQERKVLNPDGKVGGTASSPDDCKYAGAYMQIGGLYVCPGE